MVFWMLFVCLLRVWYSLLAVSTALCKVARFLVAATRSNLRYTRCLAAVCCRTYGTGSNSRCRGHDPNRQCHLRALLRLNDRRKARRDSRIVPGHSQRYRSQSRRRQKLCRYIQVQKRHPGDAAHALFHRGAAIVFTPIGDVVFFALGSGDYDELACVMNA